MPTLVALLTICVALPLGGALIGARWRAASIDGDGSFRCKVRCPYGRRYLSGVSDRWSRRRSALWIHDVLLVPSGLLRPRVLAMPVRAPEDVIRHAPAGEVSRLGASPLTLRLRLDDGVLVDLAAEEHNRTLLAGPFLAAAIPGLDKTPPSRRHDMG